MRVRCLALALGLALLAPIAMAQRVSPPPGTSPPATAANPTQAPPPVARISGQSDNPDSQPNTGYDPLEAQHDMEVGLLYWHQGDYPGALARYQDAMVHDPALVEPYYRAGQIELKMKDTAEARRYWEEYLQRDPGGKWAHQVQGELKKTQNRGSSFPSSNSGHFSTLLESNP